MCGKINFHAQFFYRAELVEYLGNIFSRLNRDFGVESDFFRENIDAEDDENE